MGQPRTKHHAILIGIDEHPTGSLRGGANDVLAIKSLLSSQDYDVSIKTLVAPRSETSHSDTTSFKNQDTRPTMHNVCKAMRDTTNAAVAGDYVYIHFSGHGNYRDPSNNPEEFSNRFTGDLVLTLEDDYLNGQQFALLVDLMVTQKQLKVTIVLDCCSSGSFYRNKEDISSQQARFARSYGQEVPLTASQARQLTLSSNWLIDPQLYTAFVACGSREEAPEIKVGEKVFGKLSYCLHQILERGSPNMRSKEVFRQLRVMYWVEDAGKGQTPVVYGNKDQFFFGPCLDDQLRETQDVTSSEVRIPVVRQSLTGSVRLLAGEAHGLRVDDKVTLHYAEAGGQGLKQMVTEVHKITATSAAFSPDFTPPGAVAFAVLKTRLRLGAYPVFLDPNLLGLDAVKAALTKHSLVSFDQFCHPSYHLQLRKVQDQAEGSSPRLQILDAKRQVLPFIPPITEEVADPDDIAAVLEHLLKYQLVKDLQNGLSVDEDLIAQSISISAQVRDGGRYGPGELVEVTERNDNQWTFEINVQNNGQMPVYVYIYALSQNWKVDHVHFATLEVLSPAKDQEKGYYPGLVRQLKTVVPKETRNGVAKYMEDTIKVFITSHRTAFDILEQPEIWDFGDTSKIRSGPHVNGKPEMWFACHFTVRTMLAESSWKSV